MDNFFSNESGLQIPLDSVLNSISDSIWVIDREFRFVAANAIFIEKFKQAFGVDIITGNYIGEGMAPKALDFWKPYYERGFAGEKITFEYDFESNEEILYYEVSVSPYYQYEGIVSAVIMVSRDITQRKKSEKNLIEMQSAFSKALGFSKMGNWELNLNTFQIVMYKHKQQILEFEEISDNPVRVNVAEYIARFVEPGDVPLASEHLSVLIREKDNPGYTMKLTYAGITEKKNVRYFHLECQVRENQIVYGFTQDITERRLAEIKSEESRQLYEHLVETLPDMIILHRNGIIIFANETLYKRTGFTKEEVIGKSVLAFDRPENKNKTMRILKDRKMGIKIPDYELILPVKTGEILNLRVKSSEVMVQQLPTTLIVFEDITEIKKSHKILEENNALLTSVMNSPNHTIIFSLDKNYCYTSFNENHRKTMNAIWGCEIEVGKNMLEYIRDDQDKEKARKNFDRVFNGESFQITEQYGEAPNRFYYDNAYNPIKDEQGNITGLTVFLFDVTSLKRAEEALLKSQREVNIIFEHSFDAVFLIEEATLSIVRCNQKAVSLFEAESKEKMIEYVTFEDFLPENVTISEVKEWLNTGVIWQREVEYTSSSGRHFWGSLNLKKISGLSEMGFFIMKIIDIDERKKAERNLVEKQKQLEAIIENTYDNIWLTDTECRLLNANSAFKTWVKQKYNIELREGMSMIDSLFQDYPKERRVWKKWYDSALEGKVIDVESEEEDTNGRKITWGHLISPVKEGNEIIGMAILSRNITEKKRKLEEIRRSEELLKFAITANKEGVWDWSIDTGKLSGNQAWYDLLGYKPCEITETTADISKLIDNEDKPMVAAQVWDTRNGVTDSFECEYRLINKKGMRIWVRDRGIVVEKNSKGEAVRMVGTLENITERKLIEIELIDQQKFIRRVINAIPNLIFVKDTEGRFVLVNKAFAEYYNMDVQSFNGKHDLDLLGARNQYLKDYLNSDYQVLTTGKPTFLPETRSIDTKTGELVYYQTVKVLLTHADGKKQILGVATNITERKKAEAEKVRLVESLMQNVQDMEQFTYMVSHNFRSHVVRILGLVSLLDRENKDNPFNDYIFNTVTEEANRLDTIIGDLNVILTIRSSYDEKKEELFLRDIAESALLALKGDLEKCGGTITLNIPEDLKVYAIKTYNYSIILNLLSNAIKYRSSDRQLKVLVEAFHTENGEYLCLKVSDNGIGIDLEKSKDKLFGLYRRFHLHVEGKGIGLHITKTQVERMGGRIEVESTVNEGTTFKVYFPL
ncbi:MAG: PAS domain S-box protein [Bacteroidia bacterium]|nr:PAS domain S-box protein [Bacteroidia bacterium]